MFYKYIQQDDVLSKLQYHYLSCGKEYDQEVYGGYAKILSKVLAKIEPTIVVKITGWSSSTGIFLQGNISEITLYNVQQEHQQQLIEIVQKSYQRLSTFFIKPECIIFSQDAFQEELAPVVWASQADIYHIVHHNQVLDCVSAYIDQGHPILVHMDTHSDFMINPRIAPESIASYINTLMLLRNNRHEDFFDKNFYWVIPEHKKDDIEEYAEHVYGCDNVCHGLEEDTPYERTYFIGNQGFLHRQALPGTREIVLHVCRLQDLKSQSLLKGKSIFLDIDLDYFSCKSKYNPTQAQLIAELNRTNAFLQELCRPEVVFVCQSPDFTPAEDNEFLSDYFSDIKARKHIFPDISLLLHAGAFAADIYYVKSLQENYLLLKDPAARQYLLDILRRRQLYDVLKVCDKYFEQPEIFDQKLQEILDKMMFSTVGLTGLDNIL